MKTTIKIAVIAMMGMSFGVCGQVNELSNGNVGIGWTQPKAKLDVNGNTFIGSLLARKYLKIVSKEWPEVRFQTPDSDGQIRLGVAHANNTDYGINSGDFYVYSATSNTMPLIVQKEGDVKIGSLKRRSYLNIASAQWPEVRFQTPTSDRQIRLGVAHANNTGYGIDSGDFYVYSATSNTMPLIVQKDGNITLVNKSGYVGIGTTDTKGFELGVNGKIAANEVKVAIYPDWPDFVFEKKYDLPTLKEVENHIKEKGHLKDIPSAKEVENNGFFLGEMDAKLLQKIEELTLYTIEQEKKLKTQENKINLLEKHNAKIEKQQKEIEELKALVKQLLKDKN